MKINMNVKRTFKVNGKQYNSIEEMPHAIREAFEKAMASQAGSSHHAAPATRQTKIIFNGVEYQSIDAMPQDVRQLYENVMSAAETGVAPAELAATESSSGMLTRPETNNTRTRGGQRNPAQAEPSFSPRSLIVGALLVAVILILYFVFQSR